MNKLGKTLIKGAVIAGVAAAGTALSNKKTREKIVKGVKQAATVVQKHAEEKAKELIDENAEKLKKMASLDKGEKADKTHRTHTATKKSS